MRRPLVRLTGLAVPLGAAAVALLLTSAGPAAAGSGYGQLIANPGTVAPGQSISVLGTCPNNGQGGLHGVYSPAFVGGSASVTTTQINFSGTAMIASNASGKYTVTADCGGGNPSLTITVSAAGSTTTTSHPASTTPAAMAPSAVHTTAVAPPAAKTSSAAIVGGTTPAKSTTPVPSSPGTTAAANGPVTSTGIVRVGLAGASHSALTMTGAAAIAVAIALAGGLGFLMIRRRRTSSGSHS